MLRATDLDVACGFVKKPHSISLFRKLGGHLFTTTFRPPLGHTLLINRLDYATSGLLVVASTPEGATVAGKAFQKRDAQKFYLAILRGHIEHPYINIKEPIGEMPDLEQRKLKMATPRCYFVHTAKQRHV